jgi:hypothetical protein
MVLTSGSVVESFPVGAVGDVAGVSVGCLGVQYFDLLSSSSSVCLFGISWLEFIRGCDCLFWSSLRHGTRLYTGLQSQTPDPCFGANGFLVLEIMIMGYNAG